MPSAKSAIEAYTIDRIDYGTVMVRPMQNVDLSKALPQFPDAVTGEERGGYAYVAGHSNTGRRYVVTASPLGSAAALTEGGEFVVSLLQPHQATYVMNKYYLRCSYVAEKFAHPIYRWVPDDLICVTRTIALALDVDDDADTAHEYLERP